MLSTTKSKPRNDEKLFFWIVIVWSLVFGIGFCILMVALNRHENASGATLADSPAQAITPDHARQLVDFTLTDRTGRTITRADLTGKFLVVDFLFTSCSLTCPVVNRHMEQIQKLTADQPDVKLVSITVDPRDDTPEALAKYGRQFDARTNRWLFLTGNKSELYHLLGTSFLSQDLDDPFTYMPGNFSHTERIALVDMDGQLRAYFDGLNDHVAQAVVTEITSLRNYENE